MKRYVKLFEEREQTSSWYFGIADCEGIDSFVKQLANEDEVEGLDFLNGLGLSDQSSDELKTRDNSILGMMKIRAHHNMHRHPVVYRVKLPDWAADYIQSLVNNGKSEEALINLKGLAEITQVGKGLGNNPKKTWERIPNRSLNSMN